MAHNQINSKNPVVNKTTGFFLDILLYKKIIVRYTLDKSCIKETFLVKYKK